MANNYTQFSEILTNLTEEEARWLKEQLPTLEEAGVESMFLSDSADRLGRYLWLYAEESGDPEQVAGFVQTFLRKFRADRYWSLTFACTCSKPHVGEFGGGAVFITANHITWQNSHAFVEAEAKAFSPTPGENHVSRLVQLAEQIGLEEDALDEVVSDIASEHAASVNNQGLAGQIEYLVAELGPVEAKRTLTALTGAGISHQEVPVVPAEASCAADETEERYYELAIGGPEFRDQRRLLCQLREAAGRQTPLALGPAQGELLEGLLNLTDAIADQAADRHGIDCLFSSD